MATPGTHSVLVYPDRSAGDWSDPLASNPYFTLGLDGWAAGPFTPALTWSSDGRITGQSLNRNQAYPVARPANAETYRIRATATVSKPGTLYYKLIFGKTPNDAFAGQFWNPAGARDLSAGRHVDPGTWQVSATWVNPASIGPEYGYLGVNVFYVPTDGSARTMVYDSVVLDYLSSGGADLSCLVDEVRINHGRDDATAQPEPASATLDITVTPDDPLPVEVEIGAVVTVSTATIESTSQRFVGRITDIALGWDDAGEDTPEAGIGQIVATSLMADLGRRVVGDVPWVQELDGTRVSRIMTAAGVELDPAWSDPGTVQILARDVDSQPALDLARGVAADANGLLWHTRDGDVRYADAEHRRNVLPALVLDACDVLVTPTWKRTTEGLINKVSIGYGAEPVDGGDQPRTLASSAASITRYGEYAYTAATQLAREVDAVALAQLLMVRNITPVWLMTALPVDVEGLTVEEYDALLTLDVHSLVDLTGLPTIGTAPPSALLWVEGWVETLAYGVHDIELTVSGYCRTVPPPRWDDLDPGWLWNSISPDLTWDLATCLGPSVNRGRWNDIPASLRWSQVDPAMTWDLWAPPTVAVAIQPERSLADA